MVPQNCHPDRSVPGFPATRHSPTAAYAASRKGKPQEVRQRHLPRQEIRGSVVEGPAVSFPALTQILAFGATPAPGLTQGLKPSVPVSITYGLEPVPFMPAKRG